MTRVDLLRHGEVAGGARFRGSRDDPLTETGWAQMQAATTNPRWNRVVSSPLIRCAEFACSYARGHGLPLEIDGQLKEMHFGVWEGRTAAEIAAEDPVALERFWADPTRHPPEDSEPLTRFQTRILRVWRQILFRYPEQHTLVVTHGGVIRVLLCLVLQRPVAELLKFDVGYGALYSFRVSDDGSTSVAPDPVSKT